MCDSGKTKKTLLEELKTLRSRAAELERIEAEHKKVEQKLKQYQFMVESAHDVIFFKDLKSRYVIANDKTLEAFGLSREQVIGKNDYEIMPKKAEARKNIEDDKLVFKTGKPTEITKHMTGSDGKERWFQAIKVPQFDDKGNIIGLVGIARDITISKRAEEEMTASEERFSGLAERSFDMIFMTDAQGYLTYISAASEKIFHYKPQEMVGTHFKNYLIESEIPRVSQRFAENMQGRNLGILPMEAMRKDGSHVFVELNSSPILKDDETVGIQGIIRDITERKRAEEALRESQQQKRAILDSIPDIAWLKDKEGRYIAANEPLCRAFGIKLEDLVGKTDFDISPADLAKRYRVDDQEVMKSGKRKRIEEPWGKKKGKRIWIETIKTPIYNNKGEVIGTSGIARDITEHKRVVEALREGENKYRTLVENLPQKIFLKDRNSVYVSCNDNLARDFKIKSEEIAGKTDYDLLPKELAEKYRADDKRIIESGKTETIEEKYVQEGEERIVHTVKTPVKDAQGNVIGILGIFWDITEHKKAEEELLFKNTLLEAQTETSIDGILVVGSERKSISFNKNFGRMWNIPQQILNTRDDEKMLQYVLSQLKDPEQFLGRVKYLYAHKNEKSRDEIQFKDGRVFDRYSSPLLDSDDKYYGRVWYFRDVTERKRAEEAYRAIVDHSLQGFEILQNRRVVFANQAMAEISGYTVEEMLAMSSQQVQAFVHPEDRALVWARHRDRLKGKELPERYEFRGIRKDGTICWLEIHPRRIEYQGKPAVQVAYLDVTERKRAGEALRKARDELETRVEQRTADLARANVQLRSLASELSLAEERLRRRIATNVHDHVGQNLAISKIKIESLRESVASPELAEDLEEIRDLISQTIESTRSLTFELSPPVLYELGFEAAVEWLVRQTRQQHGLSTEFKGDRQTKPLDNDVRILLFQAVRELLVNVAKHAQAHNVTVSTRRVGNEIRVSVEDDGVGFDISQTGSHDYKTGGFGLFSIRERLGHIGGRLEVESRPGLGTRVTLTAPIDQDSQNSKEQRK